jgi:hypothetical protein
MHLSTEWDSVGNLIWTTVTSHDLRGLFHSKSRKRMQAQSRPLDLERALFSLSGIAHPCVTAVILQGAKERVKANLQTRRWYSTGLAVSFQIFVFTRTNSSNMHPSAPRLHLHPASQQYGLTGGNSTARLYESDTRTSAIKSVSTEPAEIRPSLAHQSLGCTGRWKAWSCSIISQRHYTLIPTA